MGVCWSDDRPSDKGFEIPINKKKAFIPDQIFDNRIPNDRIFKQVEQSHLAQRELIVEKEPKNHVTVYSF